MIQTFLRAKHWHLFILLFGIPMLFQFGFMGMLVSEIINNPESDPAFVLDFVNYFIPIMIFVMAVFLGWFWSIGVGLQSRIPDDIPMKVGRFKAFIVFPLIYIVLLLVYIGFMFNSLISNSEPPNPAIFMLIFPLHLFAMFCMFHSLYFVAKTIKTAELQRKTTFGDFAGEFFLLWFYPVGIWFVQPRVNKLAKDSDLPS